MFAVSFNLLAAEYILNMSIATIFNNRALLPDNFWGMSKHDLGDFDKFCEKISTRISSILKETLHSLPSETLDKRKLKMFDLIYAKKGSVSVKDVSETVHWSSRQINRYFTEWFGLSLKAYCNILRFKASFPNLKAGKLFPERDFADQAHFIKEIKKYSGYTPKDLHKNENNKFVQLSTLK
jgi:AraC-like DNA-binding protein